MSDDHHSTSSVLEDRLRLRAGFDAGERPGLIRALAPLERHLAKWRPEDVRLELSVKDRGGPEQQVKLEAWLPRLPPMVATSHHRDVDHALVEARKELIRQIEEEKDRHAPGKTRRRR
jgi:hypothetical protein